MEILFVNYINSLLIEFPTGKRKKFLVYLNSKHNDIKFSCDVEHNNSLPFLDTYIYRDNNTFESSVYRKSTLSGLGTHFFSCTPEFFKFNSIATLVNRVFSISSSWSLFHVEIDKLRNYFLYNKYPLHVFE